MSRRPGAGGCRRARPRSSPGCRPRDSGPGVARLPSTRDGARGRGVGAPGPAGAGRSGPLRGSGCGTRAGHDERRARAGGTSAESSARSFRPGRRRSARLDAAGTRGRADGGARGPLARWRESGPGDADRYGARPRAGSPRTGGSRRLRERPDAPVGVRGERLLRAPRHGDYCATVAARERAPRRDSSTASSRSRDSGRGLPRSEEHPARESAAGRAESYRSGRSVLVWAPGPGREALAPPCASPSSSAGMSR